MTLIHTAFRVFPFFVVNLSRLALTGQIFGWLVFSKFGEKSVFIFREIQKGRIEYPRPLSQGGVGSGYALLLCAYGLSLA